MSLNYEFLISVVVPWSLSLMEFKCHKSNIGIIRIKVVS